ncbi:GAP family protein [Paeniglutamicibacter sp. R2-26]|uniref:GAP family protein n=1 Tax=Paeniglutamicibacter sp. R2-26 TaxID=3144417 RepID=UPI003EE6395E
MLLTLGLLALVDATSIGTLVIPLWLALRSRQRRELRGAVLYLGVVGAFYLVVGLLVLAGASRLQEALSGDLFNAPVLRWAALAVGAGMFAWVVVTPVAKSHQAPGGLPRAARSGIAAFGSAEPVGGEASRSAGTSGEGATGEPAGAEPSEGRWRGRIDRALSSRVGIVVLGLSAGLLELPTMLPYVGAIGLLTQSGLAVPAQAGLLVAYCLVMVIPGLTVIGLRAVAGQRMQRALAALSGKLARISGESVAWIVGIVGFLLVRSSLGFLFPGAGWNPFA